MLGGDGAKKDLRRRKDKAAARSIKVEGEDMGKALNSSPKANFRGELRGLQSMLRPRVEWRVGRGWWLGRGSAFRT